MPDYKPKYLDQHCWRWLPEWFWLHRLHSMPHSCLVCPGSFVGVQKLLMKLILVMDFWRCCLPNLHTHWPAEIVQDHSCSRFEKKGFVLYCSLLRHRYRPCSTKNKQHLLSTKGVGGPLFRHPFHRYFCQIIQTAWATVKTNRRYCYHLYFLSHLNCQNCHCILPDPADRLPCAVP